MMFTRIYVAWEWTIYANACRVYRVYSSRPECCRERCTCVSGQSVTAFGRRAVNRFFFLLFSFNFFFFCFFKSIVCAVPRCVYFEKMHMQELNGVDKVIYILCRVVRVQILLVNVCFSRIRIQLCRRQRIGYKRVSGRRQQRWQCEWNEVKIKMKWDLPLLTVFDSASTKSIFDILEERCAPHTEFVASSSFVMPLSSCLMSKLLLLLPLLPSLRLRSSSKELPIELDPLRFKPELSLSSANNEMNANIGKSKS